jgi:transitional endoplasmic reticulum ATPase
VPGVEGVIKTERQLKDGRLTFVLQSQLRRKDKPTIQELFKRVREHLKANSIYRGQAMELQTNEDGSMNVEKPPRFMNLGNVDPSELVLAPDKNAEVEAFLFSLIKHAEGAANMGIPKKQVVLLEGPHGTGKTFIGLIAALLSTQNERTAFMVNSVQALPAAIEMARIYGKSLVFAEDFDRVSSGERDQAMDRMINLLDGHEKDLDIIVVLTTNNYKSINMAFRRAGRIDAPIKIDVPTAESIERLMRQYARGYLSDTEDITGVGEILHGFTASDVRGVVESAKKFALAREQGNVDAIALTCEDLRFSAVAAHDRYRERDEKPEVPALDKVFGEMIHGAASTAVERYFANGGAKIVAKEVRELF